MCPPRAEVPLSLNREVTIITTGINIIFLLATVSLEFSRQEEKNDPGRITLSLR